MMLVIFLNHLHDKVIPLRSIEIVKMRHRELYL